MNPAMLLLPKSQVNFLTEDNSVRQGLEKFKVHGFTAVPLLSRSGEYIGTVSDKDFLLCVLEHLDGGMKSLEDMPITDMIRPDFNPPVSIDADMDQLFSRVMDQNFVPVVDSRGLFVGIITRKAVLGYIHRSFSGKISG